MESMREVLRRSLGRSLEALPALDRLAAAWPVACGKAMASWGTIVSFEAGVVRVEVRDEVSLAQLRSMGGVLQNELARIAGVPVCAIHFDLRKLRR